MSRVEQVVSCFKGGFNCSQAVLSTYAEDFDLDREAALKLAAGFGSGMGRNLIQCDIDTPEGLALAEQQRIFATVCPKFVQDAAEILEEMLA